MKASNRVAGSTVPVTEGIINGTTKSKFKIDKKVFKICNIIKIILDKFPIFIRGVFRFFPVFLDKPYSEVRDSWHILSRFALKEYRQFSVMLREAYHLS